MKTHQGIAHLSLTRSFYFHTADLRVSVNDAHVVTASANIWLVRVLQRAVAARPYADWLAGHHVLKAANDMAWGVAA